MQTAGCRLYNNWILLPFYNNFYYWELFSHKLAKQRVIQTNLSDIQANWSADFNHDLIYGLSTQQYN